MELSLNEWKDFLSSHPEVHLLQTGEWGELKSAFGWQPVRVVSGENGVQILFRQLIPGLTLAYLPKPTPFIFQQPPLLEEIDHACHARRAFLLKIEPDSWITGYETPFPESWSLVQSPHGIQPNQTIIVDLRGSEEEILNRMKQKTRYNIRLSEKKDVTIHPWDDLRAYHQMSLETSKRDGFGVHTYEYYQRAYDLFHPVGMCELLVARHAQTPLAALMVFARGKRAWYFYGASTDMERNRMPTYLLQWEAMRWAKALGCDTYDLWGVPDEDEDNLEAHFTERNEGLWGVYRFKRGFGGELKRSTGTLDRVYSPWMYRLYRLALNRMKV